MKIVLTTAALFALSQPAFAQSPMSGAEFDAYTRGRTLTYLESGVPYGVEQYLDGRQVIWAFEGNECLKGRWSEPEPGLICFTYDKATPGGPQCWNFFETPGGLRAEFSGETEGPELYETRRSNAPLFCPGPEVGA